MLLRNLCAHPVMGQFALADWIARLSIDFHFFIPEAFDGMEIAESLAAAV